MHIRLMPWCNRYRQHKSCKRIQEDGSFGVYQKMRKKGTESIFTDKK